MTTKQEKCKWSNERDAGGEGEVKVETNKRTRDQSKMGRDIWRNQLRESAETTQSVNNRGHFWSPNGKTILGGKA